jgi:GntR family transcriptional regulator, phosphonate transport system regulatory protein
MERVGVSRWRQVGDALTHEMSQGVLAPGDKLPSEVDLAARFGVTRPTIRRALGHLQDEGLLRIEHGRGTFVTDGVIKFRIGSRAWFEQNLLANAMLPSRETVSVSFLPANEFFGGKLEVGQGEEIAVVLTLGRADGQPLGLSGNYLPTCRLPGLARRLKQLQRHPKKHFSFFDILRDLGHAGLRRRTMRIRARPGSDQESFQLALGPGECVLETASLIVDANDRPIFYSTMAYASSRMEFFIDPEMLAVRD